MTYQLELPEVKLAEFEVKKAIAAALFASVFLGLGPILIRIAESYISPNTTIFNRFWIGAVILGFWKVFWWQNSQTNMSEKEEPEKAKILIPLLVTIFTFFASQMFWVWSIAKTTVANAGVLQCLTPGFTALVGFKLFKHKFGWRLITGIVAAMVGAIGIGFSNISSSISLEGDGLALLSAIFSAAHIISVEKLRNYLSSTVIVICTFASASLLSLPILLIAEDSVFPNSEMAWIALTAAAINMMAGQSLAAYSLKWLPSGLMTTILLLSPIITAIMGWFLFSETLIILNLFGFVIIIGGIYLAISDTGKLKTVE